MESGYRVGERVDGLYDENTDGMWYPGRVQCVHAAETRPDGSSGPIYEVLYDDGEAETQVRPEFLRQHIPGTICVGTRVLSRYDGGDEAYPGQVADVQSDGRYTIAYDDGEVEEDVALELITEQETEAPTSAESEPIQPQEQTQAAAPEEVQAADLGPEKLDSNVDTVHSSEEPSNPGTEEPSVEYTDIVNALDLLESRLEDAVSTKSELSILVKQMRAYPQLTVALIQERDGERLVLAALKFHQSHAVIQCYGFVLLRRLCFLCAKSTHYLLRNDIVEIVLQAMNTFAEDAILQASACGVLAVFTRVHAGLRILLEYQVSKIVLSTLVYHKTYSVHTRQVHYYACEGTEPLLL
ncbi:hypothetical protein BBJ28_00015390 [Nothophytophthora sp. Chile5]|nr:hypothetical protein BBJ28_00015390 [Nothophytophthora sp. Chile5]